MPDFKAGFARVDITPPLGTVLSGYYSVRYADGVLDPLYATAVAFDDGRRRAIVYSVDNLGFEQKLADLLREAVSKRVQIDKEAVFICCTHTHLGPGPDTDDINGQWEDREYIAFLTGRIVDAAVLAMADLTPARLLYTHGKAEDVSFIRRFRMKDGSVCTNPGYLNPQILEPLGQPDEQVSLLIIRREGKPEIGIVNFQVHPDVIGGCKISADYPKFVRDTYEKMVEGSLCMYINGAQGDSNHIDVRLGESELRRGYARAKYMGKKIALAAAANYELAKEISVDRIAYGQKNIWVKYNKGTPEEVREAIKVDAIYQKGGVKALEETFHLRGMGGNTAAARAARILALEDLPAEKELYLTAVAIGDAVFAGFPGEPFTQMGRDVKENSRFALTMPACTANGYEGYYPVRSAFEEGGYEAESSRYQAGTAEKLVEALTELVNGLKNEDAR